MMRTLEPDRRGAVVPSAVAIATLTAGLLGGCAIGTGSLDPVAYTLAGLVAAMPVALAFAWWATRRSAGASLAALGALAFDLTLALEAGRALTLQPLVVGGMAVGVVGLIGVALGRLRLSAIPEGLVLAWLAAAFLLVGAVIVHGA